MPLVAHSKLPTFDRLRQDGQEVLDIDRASSQDIREMHIGLLNMMPDAALQATERQFLRLVGSCNRIAQFHVHPFTIEGIERQGDAKRHVDTYYERFADLQRSGLDALIITGANVTEPDITQEVFWEPLIEVMDWSMENISSTLNSCLASHAAFKHYHDIDRTHLAQKQWGVYSHRTVDQTHPLLANINTRFDTPHSRFNDVPREQIEAAGIKVLVDSKQGGVLVATSPDQFRFVYLQGHPEYDINSLAKEYKREVMRFIDKDRSDYPPFPENYFGAEAQALLNDYKQQVIAAIDNGDPAPDMPEARLQPELDNTWSDTGKAIFNNWLGLVYQLTHSDRTKLYMPGIDPDDPLGMNSGQVLKTG